MQDLTRLQVSLKEKDSIVVERYYKNGIPSVGWVFKFKQHVSSKEEDVAPITLNFTYKGEKIEVRVPQQTVTVSGQMLRFKTAYVTSDDFLNAESCAVLSNIENDKSAKFRLSETIRKTIGIAAIAYVEFSTGKSVKETRKIKKIKGVKVTKIDIKPITVAVITLLAIPTEEDKKNISILDSVLSNVLENRKELINTIIQQFINEEKSNIATTAAQNKGIPNPSREGGQEYHRSLRDTQ
jgi:hypothetical protein